MLQARCDDERYYTASGCQKGDVGNQRAHVPPRRLDATKQATGDQEDHAQHARNVKPEKKEFIHESELH
jgi:hypothetical protein